MSLLVPKLQVSEIPVFFLVDPNVILPYIDHWNKISLQALY
jgi:hypothetical protein